MFFFFILILIVYSFINSYIIYRGWQFLSIVLPGANKKVYIALMVILSLLYIFGMFALRGNYSNLSRIILNIGASWMVLMIYVFVYLVGIDIFRVVAHFVKPLNSAVTENSRVLIIIAGSMMILLLVGIFVVGSKIASTPRVTTYNFDIQKNIPGKSSMKIVFVSDIHLGITIGKERLKEIIDKINSLNPDLVLLGGDIIDGDAEPYIREKMGEEFKHLRAPLGLFGVLGNHEYFGKSVYEDTMALEDSGIKVLVDDKILINNSFYIVGRDDRSGSRVPNKSRKNLKELMEGVDQSKPVILLDHQPFDLHEASSNYIDLQLSGHTHHGQFWPINLITKKMYENDWGQIIKDKTNIIVSCGAGTWGPMIRIGSYSEIVEINAYFSGQ